jgi:hypothetical protein
MSNNIEIGESSKVQLDIKTLIGIVLGILSIAGVWFTLTAEIATLQMDVVRLQYNQSLNDEFRIKWPRGELGALPADGRQDLKIEYIEKDLEEIYKLLKEKK